MAAQECKGAIMRKQWSLLAVVLTAVFQQGAVAQNITGTILGTITDSTSAVITNAKVTVTNEATNVATNAYTSATGEFVAPNLPPGIYTVSAESAGFATRVVKGVTLAATRSVRVDLTLDPGAVTQVVEVDAAAQ
jgi:hypothetical protein